MVAKAIPKETEVHAAVKHAAQVAQDAAGYSWPAVREWSQSCLALIEDGSHKWENDSEQFARDRTQLSWIKGKPAHEVKVPCHAHNADKCNERATHYSEGKTWVHGCAVCVYGLNDDAAAQSALNHTARTCRRKGGLRQFQDDQRGDRRRNNQLGGRRDDRRDNRQDQQKPKN